MPLHIQRGLALIGFGLLLAFFGLLWVANLFGVADEHAKRIAASGVNQAMAGHERTAEDVSGGVGWKVARYVAGGGFLLAGLITIGGGIAHLVAPPVD